MKDQLLELFGDVMFRFEFRCDNITEYVSVVPIDLDDDYCYIKVYFFDDSSNVLFAYETFKDISEKYKVYRIEQLSTLVTEEFRVLYHQKFDEDEFY